MNEERQDDAAGTPETGASAGRLLRQARQAQGMHIAVLAAAIKVSTRKLEALESDRFDELPDATFTRALAQTVCRALKIDPAPVLALLPPPSGYRLEQLGEGINAPLRERPGQDGAGEASRLGSPAVWAPLVVLLLAAVVYFLPAGLLTTAPPAPTPAPEPEPAPAVVIAPAPAASLPDVAATEPEPAASAAVETVHSTPPPAADDAASAAAPALAAGLLQLRAGAESWVEVIDARGRTLLSRILTPGEAVGVDGLAPLRVTIGNASETEVVFRGRPVEMGRVGRDNVARLELK